MSFSYVSWRSHLRRPRTPVLDRLSWSIPSARTLLLGPNGAGKSTLLQLVAGLLRPTAGSISGCTAADIGHMPQTVRAIPGLTVLDQVAYCGWLKGLNVRRAREAGSAALADVRLTATQDDAASALSGGQLRRLGLAQAMVGDSRLLLLDEPTAGLDPAQRDNFTDIMSSLSVPVLVASHQIEDIQRAYQQVAVMLSGSIAFEGSVADFLGQDPTGGDDPRQAYRAVLSDHGAEWGA